MSTTKKRADDAARRLTKQPEFEIDVKRFYIPGLEAACPRCGKKCEHDYLSHPTANKAEAVTFYCGSCDDAGKPAEFEKMVTVHVELEIS